MQQFTLQTTPQVALIGMDVCTTATPDLRTFERTLVMGRGVQAAGNGQSLSGFPFDEQGRKNGLEERFVVCVRRALEDSGLEALSVAKSDLSVMIQQTKGVHNDGFEKLPDFRSLKGSLQEKCSINLLVENNHLFNGKFHHAIDDVLDRARNSKTGLWMLASFFSDMDHDGQPLTSEKDANQKKTGIACFIFGRPAPDNRSYALVQLDSSSPVPKQKDRIDNHMPDALQFMRAALSVSTHSIFQQPSEEDSPAHSTYLKPCFPDPYTNICELTMPLSEKGLNSSILLQNDGKSSSNQTNRISNMGYYLIPTGFDQIQSVAAELDNLSRQITAGQPIETLCQQALTNFARNDSSRYTLALLASNAEEMQAEIGRAKEGVAKALETGKDWQTPMGSFFTPNPVGNQGKIAFVYPGAFGTYIGMGSEIFYLFPQLFAAMQLLTDDAQTAINADVIFPSDDSAATIKKNQQALDHSPTMMISSGTCFSILFTIILRDIFKVNPDAAFGYSLGEISMMFATGIWTQADAMRTSLEVSPLFNQRVSGRQQAIREFWDMPDSNEGSSIWANYVLMAPYEKVLAAIKPKEHVYITHINTPRQVVIGGEDGACRRIAEELKCMLLKAPYDHAIHCEPVQSEFETFRRLNDWPIEFDPHIPIYSAADYAPLRLESGAVADSFARMLTQPINFPRLVNQAYADGVRVFIELGAGSNCSKWIDATLKDHPHASLTINQPNVRDHVAILRLLARLVSHAIPLDMHALMAA